MAETNEQKFLRFHEANPGIYDELVALARQARRNGRTKIGIWLLYAGLRWNRYISTTGDSWKLNNNYAAWYARLIMDQEPDLADFFETREIKVA